jgi:hypothetical protein
MKFITLTSTRKSDPIRINVDMIGHYYSEIDNDNRVNKIYTVVGVLTHNNGGFRVQETPEEIDEIIKNILK